MFIPFAGEVPPGSWQTSTTQMTDGSLATVHHWTGATPPVYPPNCTVQSMEHSQQPTESYILQVNKYTLRQGFST